MHGHSFLIGRTGSAPAFTKSASDFEIGYANDWVPLGWLALFEPRDVQLVDEPPDSETYDPEQRQSCPTLIKRRDAAMVTLKRRSARLTKLFPSSLREHLRDLEAAIAGSRQPHVQVLLTDLDEFVSYPGSEKQLRDLVAALDGEDLAKWRSLLSHVHGDVGKTLSDIALPHDMEDSALVGYLHKTSEAKIAVNGSEAPPPVTVAPAVKAKKPWWKFW
ncbi:MAG: hypothetical protein K8S25_09800 [Alphaproteobacteria bacterium]|nr:hypothetical protein [Alphaproteobacteria bacterium]